MIANSLMFYGKHFDRLLVISFIILLSLLLLQTIIVNYIYSISTFNGITLYGDLANAVFTLLIVVMAQGPFIKYVLLEENGEERKLKRSLVFFADQAFTFFLFGTLLTWMVVVGSLFLLIPGIILLVFYYLTPYFIASEEWKIGRAMKKSANLAKKKFFSLLGILLLIGLLDWGLGVITIYLSSLFIDIYFGVLIAKLIVSVAIYPFGIILLTLNFLKWKEEWKEEGGLGDVDIRAV
ncbi:hypothetical protein [Sutcliffiella cohnii]|uniref:hypothetical protein n=1 Tax=Sutcliffiella cohnii TaxID=33932 RepID=UPI002E1BED21|nr:hypothetical protein [Sutcliffiella cohnii]